MGGFMPDTSGMDYARFPAKRCKKGDPTMLFADRTGCSAEQRVRGWTTVEIMIAVIIIGLLAAIAVPLMSKARRSARNKQAETDVQILAAAILQLAWDTGKWPGGLDRSVPGDPEITDLTTADAGLILVDSNKFPNWKGPYVREILRDPWGARYFFDPDYRISGVMRPVVGSFGPNGSALNVYDDDNIYVTLDD